MTVAGAPLASAPEQNSAYARNKEGRFGKPGRPSLFTEFSKLTEWKKAEDLTGKHEIGKYGKAREVFWTGLFPILRKFR
jgi:hypothetical protein